MEKKDIKLYNLMFPIWLIWLVPITWLVILPGNFLIDLLVTSVTLKVIHAENIKFNIKSLIIKTWIFGFICDFAGMAVMYAGTYIDSLQAIMYNPFENMKTFLWVTGCVIFTALLIYTVNRYFCLRKTDLTISEKGKLALSLAIFTAPYLFYLPTEWLYR